MDEEEAEIDPSAAATLSKSIGFQRIDIVLDHPQKVYYSGRQISGNVHLDLEQPTSGVGIRLKCKGEAQVYFTDRSAGIRRKFSAFENYLHVETYLVGDGKEKCMITGGVYPFSLTLSENLPCSFEGRYGRVRYSIRALLDVTTIYRFSTNIIPFTVAPILDLNRDPLATLPINIKQSKMYIGQTEALSMSMALPVHGYVPGQTIPIQIVMINPSTVMVKKLRIVFKKVEACVDVSEWYYRMFQKNLKLRTNIVVGTVPLQNYETPQKTVDVTEAFSFHPPCTTATEEYANDTPPLKNSERVETARPSLSLPLYEKSQIYRSSKPDMDDPTGDDGDSDGEVKPYSPMYRVYKFKSSHKKGR
ncbi:PREDICTED: arrestin domain-containing protein 17-like isoform X3 [Eufriesea mexicana]|uniref:arrestin domain-containing protein 17-like isoform X3 n=1 Tax=Eufriesea mexicana TaxID=516756 RepID=UPI00083C54AC|nr:PREDICTED: arrestin domain-containing protein 17-like isoform X3 [Eufriesea mexicana]